jgi:lipid-binding SYLF domain-containing protein
MKYHTTVRSRVATCALLFVVALAPRATFAASAAEIDREVTTALKNLYEQSPAAKTLGETAKGVLVFPRIVKGGFIVGGEYGNGALRKDGRTSGYYNTAAASYGLQAGVQSFGYALFFMDDASLAYLDKSRGWEIGAGPSVVVFDEGMGKSIGTTASREGVIAFIFGQKGLMAGIGLKGAKITPLTPDQ